MRKHLKGIKSYANRKTGKIFSYHRATGLRIYAAPMTVEYIAEIKAAEAQTKVAPSPIPGSLKMVIASYLGSHEFLNLQPATKQEYRRMLDELSIIDAIAIRDLRPPDIIRIRDSKLKNKGHTVANKTLATLSILFSYAIERGYAEQNPVRNVKKIKRPKNMPRKNRVWTMEEFDVVFSKAHATLKLPLLIARWTGLRQGDVLKLKNSDYDGEAIRCVTMKRDEPVAIPVSQNLATYLDNLKAIDSPTICNNSRGKTWTTDGFKTSLFKFIRNLEKDGLVAKGLTFHGLRHTLATQLSEYGFDNKTIADMLGQKSEAMAAHYSRFANLLKKLKPVIDVMSKADHARTILSNKTEKIV